MKKLKFATMAAFTALTLIASTASAQMLKVSTGEKGNTYSKMYGELTEVCKDSLQLVEATSTGSVQNIDRLMNNEVNGAFSQTDVVFFRSRTEDMSNIKTLIALHPEEVHVVALANPNIKEGGTLGFGAKTVQFNGVEDLVGRIVVASGGSFITAQVIRLQAELNYQVHEVPSSKDALALVESGKAAAAILVGGQRLGAIEQLDRRFKLLSFSEQTVAKLKSVYRPSRLNYANVGAAGVPTIATDAIFLVREYKTPKFVEGVVKLRQCAYDNITALSEEPGKHKAWQKVQADNQSKWAYYQAPAGTPAAKPTK